MELLVYVNSRFDGEAHCEVIPDVGDGEEPPVYTVYVEDDGDPLIAPILQRAVEEAGYNFEVEDFTEEEGLAGRAFLIPVPDGITRTEPTMPDINKETA